MSSGTCAAIVRRRRPRGGGPPTRIARASQDGDVVQDHEGGSAGVAGEVDAPSDSGDVGGSKRNEHQVRRSGRRVERGGVSARGSVDDRDARAEGGASCRL